MGGCLLKTGRGLRISRVGGFLLSGFGKCINYTFIFKSYNVFMPLRGLREPRDRLPLPGLANCQGWWIACPEPAFHVQTDQSKGVFPPIFFFFNLTLTHSAYIPPALNNSGQVGTRQPGTASVAQSLPKLFTLTHPKLFTLLCLAFLIETPIKAVAYAFSSPPSCFCLLTKNQCLSYGPCGELCFVPRETVHNIEFFFQRH